MFSEFSWHNISHTVMSDGLSNFKTQDNRPHNLSAAGYFSLHSPGTTPSIDVMTAY